MINALISALICGGAAVLEGVAAGRGVRARFTELRLPPCSPPLALWVGIGLAYYVICFAVLVRLLALSTSVLRAAALGLLLAILLVNAGWGVLFFRLKDVRASYLAFFPYAVLVLALGGLLVRIDPIGACILLPYLMYLVYATWWGRALWRLNDLEALMRDAYDAHAKAPRRPLG